MYTREITRREKKSKIRNDKNRKNVLGQVVLKRSPPSTTTQTTTGRRVGGYLGGSIFRSERQEGEKEIVIEDGELSGKVSKRFIRRGTANESTSNFCRAMADIYITTVGAGIFALPISILPMGIGAGMFFVVMASILSLFTNYGLMYAIKHKETNIKKDWGIACKSKINEYTELSGCGSYYEIPINQEKNTDLDDDEGEGESLMPKSNASNPEEEESEPYFEVIGKFLNFPFAESLFSIVFWILILISCVAYFVVLKSYLISIFDAKDIVALQADSAGLWIFIVAILALLWSIAKNNAKSGTKEGGVFKRIDPFISMLAAITTTVAALGTIIVFIVQWSQQGCPWRNFGPQPIPEEYLRLPTKYLTHMYLGSAIPTLCMAFLNHTNTAKIVEDYISLDSRSIAKSRQFRAIWLTQLVVTILYAAVPFFALLAQGDGIKGNVLLTMTSLNDRNPSSGYIIVGKILQACSGLGILGALFNIYLPTLVRCTFKLPLVSLCEKLRGKKCPCWRMSVMAIVEPLVTCVSSIGCYLVAILSSGGLDLFMSLGGSLSASAIMFVFPGFVFARIMWATTSQTQYKKPGKEMCWRYSMVVFACVTFFAGIIFAVFGTFWIYKVGLIDPDMYSNSTIFTLEPADPNWNTTSGPDL